MFVLYTWQDTPIYCGLLMRRTYPTLGKFDTYDDACGYAFNVCGFTTSDEFFINYEEEDDIQAYAPFCERHGVARFATSLRSVVACSFKSKGESHD